MKLFKFFIRASNVPTDMLLHDKKQIPLRQDTLLRSIYLKRGPQQQQRQQRQGAVAGIQSGSPGIVETRSSAGPEESRRETKKKSKESCIAM